MVSSWIFSQDYRVRQQTLKFFIFKWFQWQLEWKSHFTTWWKGFGNSIHWAVTDISGNSGSLFINSDGIVVSIVPLRRESKWISASLVLHRHIWVMEPLRPGERTFIAVRMLSGNSFGKHFINEKQARFVRAADKGGVIIHK